LILHTSITHTECFHIQGAGFPSDNGGVNLSDHLLALFPPERPADVDILDETLLPTVAGCLKEEPTVEAVAARSPELPALIEDLLADWRALALASQQQELPETMAQLRAVAQYAAETLAELVDGMTWAEPVGTGAAMVRLSERDGVWSYRVAHRDTEFRSTTEFRTKAAARDGAIRELRERSGD
jgi:hypothetical protein